MARNPLIAAMLLLAAPLTQAQPEGKLLITKLFNSPAATATASTVRVRCNGKDTVLGTIIDASGFIVTKGSELKGSVSVRLRDGSEYDAEYIGYHEKSDLALLKVDASDLAPVKIVDAKLAEAGNMVAAPGMDSEPLVAGIVSAGVRKLYGEEARIVNGNKGWLGISVDSQRKGGVFVGEFNEDTKRESPAYKAKVKVGDQILSIEGNPVESFEDLAKILSKFKAGDKVKLQIKRKAKDSEDAEEIEIEVKLANGSLFDRSELQNRMGSALSARRTGFPQVITTDLVIKPADCGGPLVDLEGRVLGVIIARAGRVETWVLPKSVVDDAVKEMKTGKLKPKS